MTTQEKKDASTYNFEHKRQALIAYMRVKMDEGDWHGVADAANDLRVLEAQGLQKSADGEGE